MTDGVNGADAVEEPGGAVEDGGRAGAVEDRLVGMLVDRARAEGLQPTGEGGLLQQLTTRVPESAPDGEMTDDLGCERHEAAGKNGGNSRNGRRAKTVTTDVGRPALMQAASVSADISASEKGLIIARSRSGLAEARFSSANADRGTLSDAVIVLVSFVTSNISKNQPVAVLRVGTTRPTGSKPPERVEPVHHFQGRNRCRPLQPPAPAKSLSHVASG